MRPFYSTKAILFFSLIFICCSATVTAGEGTPKADKKIILLDQPVEIPLAEINAWIHQTLHANEQTAFEFKNAYTDKIGFTHYKYYQTYRGHRVQDGIFIVHTQNGKITSANGEYYPDINVATPLIIAPQTANDIARRSMQAEIWAGENAGLDPTETAIIATAEGYRCTYKVDLFTYEPLLRQWLYIDTQSGEVVAERNRISHITVPGEAHCYYHGVKTVMVDSVGPSLFNLRDYSRGSGIVTLDLNGGSNLNAAVDFIDEDNVWDTTSDNDHAALDAHWASSQIYDYMLEVHNWDSYDNQGSLVHNYVHHSTNTNAAWVGDGMVYGDGDGSFFNPLTAAEVVGHEFMHGYSEGLAGWGGGGGGMETFALNEGFSDIFSVIFEHHFSPSTANYLIGDMVSVTGQAIRNMEDPKSLQDPDTYLGEFWNPSAGHKNANVLSYGFYLLTQGGFGTNDNSDDYSVSSISMTDAADILFRTLAIYLSPSANFADVRTHGIQSCIDLFGSCSYQEIQFTNAMYAIGLGDKYVGPPLTEIALTGDPLVNEVLTFSSNASMASTWAWDFDDGNTSTEEMPAHSYSSSGTYQVILDATYPNGCIMSDTLFVNVNLPNKVNEIPSYQISLYPNPAQENIYLEYLGRQQLINARLVNVLGQSFNKLEYRNISSTTYEIKLESIPAGVYFVELTFADGSSALKKFYLSN